MLFLKKRTETIDGVLYKVTDFTKDGETVSHSVKCLVQSEQPNDPTVQNSPLSTENTIKQLRSDNIILMDAIAIIFEEIATLKEQLSGGV